jgi:hypothetical protein
MSSAALHDGIVVTVTDLPDRPDADRALDVPPAAAAAESADAGDGVEDGVVRVDAGEVIRCMADPDDETLLSAAQYARDRLGLTAATPDEDLAGLAVRTDAHLRAEMYLASDQTVAALRQLRAALAVHAVAAAVRLGRPADDDALAATTAAGIGAVPDLTPVAVRDVVRETVATRRAQAIADAVAGVRAAYRAIDDAETAHRARIADLKAALRTRIETAIATGRPVGALAGDLDLTRQRIDQIRKGTR